MAKTNIIIYILGDEVILIMDEYSYGEQLKRLMFEASQQQEDESQNWFLFEIKSLKLIVTNQEKHSERVPNFP